MNVIIGNAWPYANGTLHLGRLASLMPGDVLARYHRLMGDNVIFVSGSDCNGTPILMKASELNKKPEEICEFYHNEFQECFNKLGFTFDLFGRTSDKFHHEFVKRQIKELYDKGYIYEKSIAQTFCEKCDKFLPDKYVEGICPYCGGPAKGDQCEECSEILEPHELLDRKCGFCGSEPVIKEGNHLFFALSKLQNDVLRYFLKQDGWRNNAIKLTKRYLDDGLKDRAVTRDLNWGVDVPIEGYEDKKIYVWIDAIMSYLSATQKVCLERNENFEEYWNGEESIVYFVHGKDNIPFHTVIFPAILSALGFKRSNLRVLSSEYMKLEGKNFSIMKNWAIWVPEIIEKYDVDLIRCYLILNSPEKKDTDFIWREFIKLNNNELVGSYGNFVNRTLTFIHKNFDGKISGCGLNQKWKNKFYDLYMDVGYNIEEGNFKEALEIVFAFIKSANKFFDNEKPWLSIKDNKKKCKETLYTCVQIIANISNLMEPFAPFSCEKIRRFLNIKASKWSFIEITNIEIGEIEILFNKIDKLVVQDEINNLKIRSNKMIFKENE